MILRKQTNKQNLGGITDSAYGLQGVTEVSLRPLLKGTDTCAHGR